MPVSVIRTKIRQQFEKHRFVNQLNIVDVLLFQSHAEFQVRIRAFLSSILILFVWWEEEGGEGEGELTSTK